MVVRWASPLIAPAMSYYAPISHAAIDLRLRAGHLRSSLLR